MPKFILQTIENWTIIEVIFYCFILNLMILLLSVIAGNYLVNKFKNNRISPKPTVTAAPEYILAAFTLFINTIINTLGWVLWKNHYIIISAGLSLISFIDFFILFLVMDFSMFVLHRFAHIPQFYKIIHKTHHNYKHVRPLTLFVLNPMESLSFGLLWLLVLIVFKVTWPAIIAYLTLNLVFGMLGHMGVEIVKKDFSKIPFLKYLATGKFHAAHHLDETANFGFYTKIWDILFLKIQSRF